jgi:hypothetical protein
LTSSLRSLDLEGTKITSAGVLKLSEMPNLAMLDLASTKVSNEALIEIAKLPKLMNLSLQESGMTDAGLKSLETTKLSLLWLQGCNMTDIGLVGLTKIKSLRQVGLSPPCTKVGVAKAKQLLPTCSFLYMKDF